VVLYHPSQRSSGHPSIAVYSRIYSPDLAS
jgi:hypothetical protein